MESLGQIAYRKWLTESDRQYATTLESWQAVVDAVVAAHEARRWRPIESAPKTGEVMVGKWHRGKWAWKVTEFVTVASEDGYTHWTPIPAPPQEVEHGE